MCDMWLEEHVQYVNKKLSMCFHIYHIYSTRRENTQKYFHIVTMLNGILCKFEAINLRIL